MVEIIKTIVLGIIQGVTEWLPISSTGHMILVDEFLRLDVSEAFMALFLVFIQFGSILAVVVLYWRKLFPISFTQKPVIKPEVVSLWLKIAVACIPAAVIGLLFDERIDALFFNYQTVAAALVFYGIVFIVIERNRKNIVPKIETVAQIGYKTALFIGLFQVLALIPGTSRSGATIIGALLLGAARPAAAEFTFFLAVPVMFGASLLRLINFGFSFTGAEAAILLVGALVAFIVSLFAIKFLVGYVKKNDFQPFGWYRIVLGVVVMGYFLFVR